MNDDDDASMTIYRVHTEEKTIKNQSFTNCYCLLSFIVSELGCDLPIRVDEKGYKLDEIFREHSQSLFDW